MKPVYQTRNHWPDGNCLMACVASVLEVELDACPDLGPDNGRDDYWDVMRQFAQRHGYDLAWSDGPAPAGYSIVSLMPPSGTPHACVELNGKIVHNPVQGEPLEFPAIVRGRVVFVPLAGSTVPLATPAPAAGTTQAIDALLEIVGALVRRFGYGSKAGRPDYSAIIPLDQFDKLTEAYKRVAALSRHDGVERP